MNAKPDLVPIECHRNRPLQLKFLYLDSDFLKLPLNAC